MYGKRYRIKVSTYAEHPRTNCADKDFRHTLIVEYERVVNTDGRVRAS